MNIRLTEQSLTAKRYIDYEILKNKHLDELYAKKNPRWMFTKYLRVTSFRWERM